ncbi:MAG: ABC transporter permease [Eubacterium sp.]|uniref:ABC transporter permease n=1 Tax=Eubacterium sp. TaxID=142586 RepID=UPI003A19A21B
MNKSKLSPASKIYMALILFFLYAPIGVMAVFSFNENASTYEFSDFSVKWWNEMFNNAAAMTALKNTILLAVCSSLLSTFIGTMASVGIFNYRSRKLRSAVMTVTNVPMMNPEIVTGISMMLLFVFAGTLINQTSVLNFWSLLIAHVTFCLPYVVLNVMPKLRQFDMNIYEAAVDLGCKPVKAFFKVVMPNITSGIITGLVMSFTLSLDDFIISYFTNGPSFQTLPIYIFSLTKKRVKPDMYALSTLMFVVILVLLILMNVAQARAEKKGKSDKK